MAHSSLPSAYYDVWETLVKVKLVVYYTCGDYVCWFQTPRCIIQHGLSGINFVFYTNYEMIYVFQSPNAIAKIEIKLVLPHN